MKTKFKTVDEYIAAQPDQAQPVLSRVRSVIRSAISKAAESISYEMPTYRLDGERLLYFAGWKSFYSLYPATRRLIEAFKGELGGYEVVKSTIRFPLSEPVPVKLIERIARFRAGEVAERTAQ